MGDLEKELEKAPGSAQESQASLPVLDKTDRNGEDKRQQDALSTAASIPSVDSQPEEEVEGEEIEPPITPVSRTTTRNSRPVPAVPVARSQRRGLLAFLTLIPEVTNPYDYDSRTKWIITITVAVAAAAAPMGSAILLPALTEVSQKLHSTPTITSLNVALYMLAMSIFPLWWSSFSESLGRRTIYIISFALLALWSILSAIAPNMAMLIVMRLLSGGAAASVQAVGAGTIADIWEVKERGKAMGIFYLGPLCGPLFAPIVGGALTQGLGWRSTQWFLVIYGGVTWILIVLALPETLRNRRNVTQEVAQEVIQTSIPSEAQNGNDGSPSNPAPLSRISTRRSVQLKTRKWMKVLHRCFVEPLGIILYLRFLSIALLVFYAAITFGTLYVLNISIEITFSKEPYNFSTTIVGLLYIPNSLGYVLASIVGGRWIDWIMHREAKKAGRYDEKGKLIFIPEDRMKENAWLAAILYPGALIWYGWTTEKGIYWFVPMLSNFFFGIGSMLIFSVSATMLTEFLPRKASAGIALNNFVRNILSFTGAFVATPVINAIGNGWLFTILGIVCIISGFGMLLSMRRWGEKWRSSIGEKLGDAG